MTFHASKASIPQLWLRLQRIKLARWALWVCRNAADFSEWVMPEDLRKHLQ